MSVDDQLVADLVEAVPRLGSKRWSTKEGRIIRVRDMPHRHALNTRSLMLRQVDAFVTGLSLRASFAASMMNGEMASLELEREAEAYERTDVAALLDATPLGKALTKRIAVGDTTWAYPFLPDPKGGCVCAWTSEDRGGGHSEVVPEYDPTCPEHSEHVYDPRAGMWIDRGSV